MVMTHTTPPPNPNPRSHPTHPTSQGVDINVGAASVSAAIVQATASNTEKLKQLYTELGCVCCFVLLFLLMYASLLYRCTAFVSVGHLHMVYPFSAHRIFSLTHTRKYKHNHQPKSHKHQQSKTRDLGDVAQALRVKQRLLVQPKPLTIRAVYQTIVDMSKMKGASVLSWLWHCVVGFGAGRKSEGSDRREIDSPLTRLDAQNPNPPRQGKAARAGSAT